MVTAWIQRYDYTSEELGARTEAELLSAFEGRDWAAELRGVDLNNPAADCPPGFGINDGVNILHLCPIDAKQMFFHLHYNRRRRYLGLFSVERRRTRTVEGHPLKNAGRIVGAFMAGDLDYLLSL